MNSLNGSITGIKEEKVTTVKLSNDNTLIYNIIGSITDFISKEESRQSFFYHIFASDESLVIEQQGYNSGTFKCLLFDVSELSEEYKEETLIQVYRGIEWRNGAPQFITDGSLGKINQYVWFHDRRQNGSTFSERNFYEKIDKLRNENTSIRKMK